MAHPFLGRVICRQLDEHSIPRWPVNILEYFLGTPDIVTNVLLMGCGDLRTGWLTAAKLTDSYKELNVHFTAESPLFVMRNIMLSFKMLADDFDPENPLDIQYLWDVWYSTQWNRYTKERFAKNLEGLTAGQWMSCRMVIESEDVKSYFNHVCHFWKSVVNKFSEADLQLMIKNRVHDYEGYVDGNETEASMTNGCLHIFGKEMKIKSRKEMECFFRTGNFEPLLPPNVACIINPTLMTVAAKPYLFDTKCPFFTHFPIPPDEHLTTKFNFEENSAYAYCKARLKFVVTEVRARMSRITIYFHFATGIDLCHEKANWKKMFHVIHCSTHSDKVGLASFISAAVPCLVDAPEAVLLSETTSWMKLDQPTVTNYVETSLCCSLSLIPTMYGVRLANHLQLASPVCMKMHDYHTKNRVMLRWLRSPEYSSNVIMELSPCLKTAISRLGELCFSEQPQSVISCSETRPTRTSWKPKCMLVNYTPVTFYYVIQSLVNRCVLVQDTVKSLLQTPVPPSLQLAWQTQQDWWNGEQVRVYSISKRSIEKSLTLIGLEMFLQSDCNFELLLLANPKSQKAKSGQLLPNSTEFIANAHCIDRLCWDENMMSSKKVSASNFNLGKDPTFSFVLTKDHELDTKTRLFLFNGESDYLTAIDYLHLFTTTGMINPNPSMMKPRQGSKDTETASGLHILKCCEYEDRFELTIAVRGVSIDNVEEVALTTDQTHPSISAHQVTLTLPNAEPLSFQVGFPILGKEIKLSLVQKIKKKKLKKCVHLILKKSLNEPWPVEFVGRSKWDVDHLKHWKNANALISQHLLAQFDCKMLSSERRVLTETLKLPIDKVREMIRSIFHGHLLDSFYLFVIQNESYPNKEAIHLRVHPPVRFSLQGTPLLLVSLLDHQIAQQLTNDGKLDPEKLNLDYHRIISEGVSRELCLISTPSSEELQLFRYSLRLNSTKIRRGAWQSKNLPRGDDSPWLATFVSPLYAEKLSNICKI